MSPLTLFGFGLTILLTSFVSGVFGMAGGLILLGLLLVYFDVPTAMVMLSIVQFAANGWRALLWSRFVRWRIFAFYVVGAIVAFLLMRLVAFIPDKALVYLLLGLMPFMAELIPKQWRPNIEWRGVPFVTGVLTTFIQLFSGVGGLFLDMFFQKSTLDRKSTVGTKAVTQSFSHVLRFAFFGPFGGIGGATEAAPIWSYGAAVVLAIAGTSLAPLVLERMTDQGFRQWTRYIIFFVSTLYVLRALWLFWYG
jgi:uncharacterized membrane protein YfcA